MKILEVEQGSPEWKAARLEKISGTRLGMAIGTPATQETLINELIAESLTGDGKENFVNLAMAKGTEAEEFAVNEYEEATGEITEKVGICESDKFSWLINSPDRLIKRGEKYSKALEIKSPNPETAIKYIRNGGVPKEYVGQVISYFLINDDLEELDFVIYSPTIQTERYRLWIINVNRSDIELDKYEEKLVKFYDKWQEELKKLNLSL